MSAVAASLVPIFLLIVTGWATRVTRTIDEHAWAGFEKVTYLVLFPALVAETLARADLASVPILPVAASLVGGILAVVGLLLALRPWLESRLAIDGPAFTSVLQGSSRWNTFVALALAAGLYGREGTTLCAVAIATMIPLLNVIAVTALSRFASPRPLSARQLARAIVTNPFIWSSVLGIALNLAAPPIPVMVWSWAEILGRAALAAGLLVVGAGLDLSRLRNPGAALMLSTVLKLAVLPVVAALLARLFGVSGTGLAITVLCTAVPTASGSYVLARQMGGDAPLMAEILTVQTLLAMLTLPLAIHFLV